LSAIRPVSPGARVGSLAEALITDEPTVRAHLAADVAPGDAFGALNAAFWPDGAFLHVPAGVRLEEPIQLLFVATAGAPGADHPRSVIVLEPESRAVLVESYVALGEEAYLTNASTEMALGPGAGLEHHRIVLEGRRAFHVGRIRVRQGPDSRFASHAVTLGGRLVRSEVDVRLDAPGAECALNGLFVVGGAQHVDTHTVVDHARPRTTSRQLYKGVLDGRSRGVFNGRVVVRPGADGTDAHQTNKNLILSDGVEVDSKPQLEIFADDVKCSHGAADGQLAEDAIFYLESRGLDEVAARTLLTHGFANEVLGRIGVEPVRAWCEELLRGRLRGGRVPEEEA
ncbi:MAG: Fe-S cluster assembly protein SufD, partial [Candidatus Rokuibacteriota bacterium]